MTTNVDQAEINKFESLSDHWWDKEGQLKSLHNINPLRVNYINDKVNLQGTATLDVGCGGGILSEAMALKGAKVTGIDMGEAPLAAGRTHAEEAGVEISYQQSTVEDFAAKHAESFELVTCLEMLEHVPDPESVITSCANLATPGGHLVFSTLNRNPKAYGLAILGAEYLLNIVPRGTHDYKKFIRPSELGRWIRNSGLELVELKGMQFNPLTNQATLSNDTDVNYFAYCRKPK